MHRYRDLSAFVCTLFILPHNNRISLDIGIYGEVKTTNLGDDSSKVYGQDRVYVLVYEVNETLIMIKLLGTYSVRSAICPTNNVVECGDRHGNLTPKSQAYIQIPRELEQVQRKILSVT